MYFSVILLISVAKKSFKISIISVSILFRVSIFAFRNYWLFSQFYGIIRAKPTRVWTAKKWGQQNKERERVNSIAKQSHNNNQLSLIDNQLLRYRTFFYFFLRIIINLCLSLCPRWLKSLVLISVHSWFNFVHFVVNLPKMLQKCLRPYPLSRPLFPLFKV